MRLLIILALAGYLAGCGNTQAKKDIIVDDRKYDLLVNLSMKNGSMDISCKRLNNEINIHIEQGNNFDVVRYSRFVMTDGIRFAINMNYNLIPSQDHQDERYKEAYSKVVDICEKDESLSYLSALSLALSSTYTNNRVN